MIHQHPRPIGPTTNDPAAFSVEMPAGSVPVRNRERLPLRTGATVWSPEVILFSPEMVVGVHADRNREFLAPRILVTPSQLTQVDAAFSQEMIAGYKPDLPRLVPFVAKTGWQTAQTTPITTFSLEQTLGSMPTRPRLFTTRPLFGPQLLSQTTPTDAPFSVEMVAGSHPDLPRLPFAAKPGWAVSQTTQVDAAFSLDMVAGLSSVAHLPFRAQLGTVALTPDVPAFSIEMIVGVHPDLPRIFLAPRIPLPPSQTTHVPTPFSVEMAAGSHPDRYRQLFPALSGWSVAQVTQTDAPFSIDMVLASRPERARLFLAPRIPLPLAQTTPVPTFSSEMAQGSHPDSPRPYVPPQFGWSVSQTTQTDARFSQEMIAGSQPPTGRGFAVHPSPVAIAPDVPVFSVEMIVGARPERARFFLAPRIPLPVSQTTPVAAPFGAEMVEGAKPDQNRERLPLRTGTAVSQTTPVDVFSPEMAAGSHPDRNREALPLRTGLRDSQTTHVPAPVSDEMMVGHHPDRPRGFSFRNATTGPWLDTVLGKVFTQLLVRIGLAVYRSIDRRALSADPVRTVQYLSPDLTTKTTTGKHTTSGGPANTTEYLP